MVLQDSYKHSRHSGNHWQKSIPEFDCAFLSSIQEYTTVGAVACLCGCKSGAREQEFGGATEREGEKGLKGASKGNHKEGMSPFKFPAKLHVQVPRRNLTAAQQAPIGNYQFFAVRGQKLPLAETARMTMIKKQVSFVSPSQVKAKFILCFWDAVTLTTYGKVA